MIKDFLLLGLFLISVFFLGKNVLLLLNKSQCSFHKLEESFLSFGLGSGLITWFLFFIALLGINFNVFWLIALVLFVYSLRRLFLSNHALKQGSFFSMRAFCKIDVLSFLCISFVVFNILVVLFKTMVIETDMWDSWAFWAFKAKLFYYDQTVPFSAFEVLKLTCGNWDYPLHLPLLETAAALWIGRWDETLYRIIFPIYFSGICVLVFSIIRRESGYYSGLMAASLVASLQSLQFWTTATIAESMMIFYWLASLAMLFRWKTESLNNEQGVTLLRLSALFMGLSLWVKSEALALLVCNVLIVIYSKKASPRQILLFIAGYLGLVCLINLPWHFVRLIFNVQNPLFKEGLFLSINFDKVFSRALNLPYVLGLFLFNFKSWNILWLAFMVTLIYRLIMRVGRTYTDLLRSIVVVVGIYTLVYLFNPWEEGMFVFDTMQRLMLSPAILAILYISVFWGDLLSQKNRH